MSRREVWVVEFDGGLMYGVHRIWAYSTETEALRATRRFRAGTFPGLRVVRYVPAKPAAKRKEKKR